MEHEPNKQPAPKVYELIHPDIQVRQLMIAILHKHQQDIKQLGRGLVELTLPDERIGSTERLLWQKESSPFVQGIISTFTLEHFPPGETRKPSISFNTVAYPDKRTVPMYTKDATGRTMNLTDIGLRTAHREALTILTDLDPDSAKYVLDRCSDNSFTKCVGGYVLSKYAYTDEPIELTDQVLDQACLDHATRIKHLTRATLRQARTKNSLDHPQPSYYEAVKEASDTLPKPNSHGRFLPVDIHIAVDSITNHINR